MHFYILAKTLHWGLVQLNCNLKINYNIQSSRKPLCTFCYECFFFNTSIYQYLYFRLSFHDA